MNRKWFALALVAVGLGSLPWLLGPASADDIIRTDVGTTKVSLKVQLERGLRAIRPQEFDFLGVVETQVDDGTLPVAMVNQAFLWARKKRQFRVQYFEKALRALAQKQGVTFDTGDISSFNPGFNTAITTQASTPPVVSGQQSKVAGGRAKRCPSGLGLRPGSAARRPAVKRGLKEALCRFSFDAVLWRREVECNGRLRRGDFDLAKIVRRRLNLARLSI